MVALLTLVAAVVVALTLTCERHFVPSGPAWRVGALHGAAHPPDRAPIVTFAIGFGVKFNFVAIFH